MVDDSVSLRAKTCITCQETKPLEAFRPPRHQCRACAAAYARDRYTQNPAKKRANSAKWSRNNPEKVRTNGRRWVHNNPGKKAANMQKYLARKLQAPINDFTAAQWRDMVIAYGHRCVYCGRKMPRLTMDHIVPLSKGGNHTQSNIVPACKSCNSKKGARTPLVPVQPLLL